MKRGVQLFLTIIFLFCNALKADTLFVFEPTEKAQRISNKFVYLLDATHRFNENTVWNAEGFVSTNMDVPNFNITKSTVWAKLKLTTTKTGNYYIKLDPASFLHVTLFSKTQNTPWQKQVMANKGPERETRSIKINHFLYRMDLTKGDTVFLLFNLREFYPITLDLKIGPLSSFLESMHNVDMYNGICYGIMIMMLIYNLFLYITNKNAAYLYYVFYVFCSILFTSILSGYSYHFPKPLMSLINFMPIIPPAGFGIFGMLFTLKLFKGSYKPGFIKMINVFMVVAGIVALLSTIPSLVHLMENVIQPLGLILGVFSMSAGIIALKKKHTSARYYLFGFGAYMASLFYLIFSAQGIVPITTTTWCILATGSALESIFLSFALGDKLRIFQKEKEKAQEESLQQSLENERLVREQNTTLERKVLERTLELQEQKEIIEEKNKEIVDSINYAKRIQYTLLAHESTFTKNLDEHFVLFKPKDIVSGDFYWATEFKDKFYLAVCDSTGHGVPGAFMSLLNISFLNEAINEHSIEKPNEVFNHVRKRLIDNISQEDQKDGMDGILITIDKKKNTVGYAAANNGPLLIRNNAVVDLEYNKMPVGKGIKEDPFSYYEFKPEPGDVLYLFTDGYTDQFGGPKGKKYKYRALVEKLIKISNELFNVQKKDLEENFYKWKGNLEQVDDVLLIGIRF